MADPAVRLDRGQSRFGTGGHRDGRVLRTSADEHLVHFWALRGGEGNFGVVTEFEFRLHH